MKQSYLLSITLLFLLACNSTQEQEAKAIDTIDPIKTKIDELGERYLNLGRFSGVILLSENGQITYKDSFGYSEDSLQIRFTDNTAFKVGEISQLFQLAVLKYFLDMKVISKEDGLNTSISTEKGDLRLNALFSEEKIHMILSNDSLLLENQLVKLLEKNSGRTYHKLFNEVSKELALENSYYEGKDKSLAQGYLYSIEVGKGVVLTRSPSQSFENDLYSRGLKTTVTDMLKIVNYLGQDIDFNGYLAEDGFSYSVYNDQKEKTAIIILSNRRQPITGEISRSVHAIAKAESYQLPLAREMVEMEAEKLDEFIGVYQINEQMQFKVARNADSLFAYFGPNKLWLLPQSDNQFYLEISDAAMRFERDSLGQVYQVRLLNGFMDSDEVAKKVK